MSLFGPKIWNKLSSNIKTAATTASFTPGLKKEILEKPAIVSDHIDFFDS